MPEHLQESLPKHETFGAAVPRTSSTSNCRHQIISVRRRQHNWLPVSCAFTQLLYDQRAPTPLGSRMTSFDYASHIDLDIVLERGDYLPSGDEATRPRHGVIASRPSKTLGGGRISILPHNKHVYWTRLDWITPPPLRVRSRGVHFHRGNLGAYWAQTSTVTVLSQNLEINDASHEHPKAWSDHRHQ